MSGIEKNRNQKAGIDLSNFTESRGSVVKNNQRVADSNFDRYQAKQGLSAKNQSQMTKLLPLLQLGSKAGPNEAQVLSKLEARAQALAELRVALHKATLSVSKLYVAEKPDQLKRLTLARKKIVLIANSKPPIGVAKALRACVNELTSLREGVFVGTATDKKTLAIVACTEAVQHIDLLIDKNAKRIAEAKSITSAGSADPVFQEEIEHVIKKNAADASKLESLKGKQFVICRVPVVAVAKTTLDFQTVKLKGFKAEDIGGYPVIHNQLVIGINKTMLGLKKSELSEEGLSIKSIPADKWAKAAMEVLSLVRKQTKVKYQLVDARPYGYAGGAWFWAMSDKDLSLFASAFPGKAISMRSWGFGF
jgi:deoxyinosine 3'endonuclease (endonuclease V)